MAFISPYAKDRDFGKAIHREADLPFYECYINSPLDVCESRDVKGLYKKARAGEIKMFTGISDPYEAPENPELEIRTDLLSIDQSIDLVLKKMRDERILVSNREPKIADSLIEDLTAEQLLEFDSLKSIEIDVEQAEYIQTLG